MSKDFGLVLLAVTAAILFFLAISSGAGAQAPDVVNVDGNVICILGECAPIPTIPTLPTFGDGLGIAKAIECAADRSAPGCK